MIKKVQNKISISLSSLDIHTLEVLKKSSASTVVKVAGMAIGLAVSIFLGRTIGAEGLGIINLSNRIVNIFLIVGLLGMRQVIIKEVAIAHNKKDYAHIGNVMHTAYWLNGGITIVLSILFILLSPWLAKTIFNEPRLTYPLMIGLVVMTPQVFSRIFSSGLIGYRKIWQSNLVEQTLSITVTGLILLIFWFFKQDITVNLVAVCYAIGRIVVTLSVGIYWKSIYRFKTKRQIITKQLLETAKPLFVITISSVIFLNADVIILGWLSDSKEVGLYTIAARIAFLTSFFLQVTNAAVAPKIAALCEQNKKDELEKMIQTVTKGLGLIGFSSLLVFIIFGKEILSIWGEHFIVAYPQLIIISIGQFLNISTGATGLLLSLCNYEKIQRNISIIFTILFLFLSSVMTYFWGTIGTAISVAFIALSLNITAVIYAKKLLNISTINFKYK